MRNSTVQRNLLALLVLCIFSFITGCTPPDPSLVTFTSMGALEVGMSPTEAAAATGAIADPTLDFEWGEQQWSANYYLHHSGHSISRYLALYDESGLRYWGFLHEFERQRNKEITAAARQAELEYLNWWKANNLVTEQKEKSEF